MTTQAEALALALSGATIPREVFVAPAQAWTLILALLAVSCGVLWLLTRPQRPSSHGPAPRPLRPAHRPRQPVRLGYAPRPSLSKS
jgi:hypothetical protein